MSWVRQPRPTRAMSWWAHRTGFAFPSCPLLGYLRAVLVPLIHMTKCVAIGTPSTLIAQHHD